MLLFVNRFCQQQRDETGRARRTGPRERKAHRGADRRGQQGEGKWIPTRGLILILPDANSVLLSWERS